MDRNSAKHFYYFDACFFETLADELRGNFFFIYASINGEVVSCELALFEGHYAHSFLGGTTQLALPLAANQLLKRDLVRELKLRGCRHFLLGGGVRADDGIERYKRAYAPSGALPSRVGGRVFDADAMAVLRRSPDAVVNPRRFQFYDPQ